MKLSAATRSRTGCSGLVTYREGGEADVDGAGAKHGQLNLVAGNTGLPENTRRVVKDLAGEEHTDTSSRLHIIDLLVKCRCLLGKHARLFFQFAYTGESLARAYVFKVIWNIIKIQ